MRSAWRLRRCSARYPSNSRSFSRARSLSLRACVRLTGVRGVQRVLRGRRDARGHEGCQEEAGTSDSRPPSLATTWAVSSCGRASWVRVRVEASAPKNEMSTCGIATDKSHA